MSALTPPLNDARWMASPPATATVAAGDGAKTLYAWVKDENGSLSARVSAQTTLDTVKPTGGAAPVAALGTAAVTTLVPLKLSWAAAADAASGPVSYTLQYSSDGGATWKGTKTVSTTSTALNLAAGTYAFHVKATDRAGNATAWFVRTGVIVTLAQENAASIVYTGTFTRVAMTGASGGYVKYASATGASAKWTTTARTFALVAARTANSGIATIWDGSTKLATIDLYSATTQAGRIVWRTTFAASGKHTIKVVVTGTKNSKSSGKRVYIDAFIALK